MRAWRKFFSHHHVLAYEARYKCRLTKEVVCTEDKKESDNAMVYETARGCWRQHCNLHNVTNKLVEDEIPVNSIEGEKGREENTEQNETEEEDTRQKLSVANKKETKRGIEENTEHKEI